jgi:hypothetical protein
VGQDSDPDSARLRLREPTSGETVGRFSPALTKANRKQQGSRSDGPSGSGWAPTPSGFPSRPVAAPTGRPGRFPTRRSGLPSWLRRAVGRLRADPGQRTRPEQSWKSRGPSPAAAPPGPSPGCWEEKSGHSADGGGRRHRTDHDARSVPGRLLTPEGAEQERRSPQPLTLQQVQSEQLSLVLSCSVARPRQMGRELPTGTA